MCCKQYCIAKAQFDRKVAEGDLRRYRRRGADPLTKLLISELRRWSLQAASLLDVGGGIGVIDMELANDGVRTATIVEASPAYFEVARGAVETCYGSRATQFVVGDFAALAPELPDADIVTLHRVVCCYPNADELLRSAAGHARRFIAYTYPRDCWYMRAFTMFENCWRRLKGKPFRTFVHSSEIMQAALEASGLARVAQRSTVMWVLDIYARETAVDQA